MQRAALLRFCRTLPGTTEDVKWGDDLCFCVGEKMYLVTGARSGSHALSIKVPSELFAALTDEEGIAPAPYLARYEWVRIEDCRRIPAARLKELVSLSHDLIAAKLPKRLRRRILGE